MFLKGTTNNWHIIKNCWGMNYSLSFTRKYNLLGLFRFIWMKGHFPLVGCVTSWTAEKKDVSSAKSLVVDDNPQLGSLIYIKKNKGARTDPQETPAETSAQD